MTSVPVDVLIAGGGPAGAIAAIALARAGQSVRLLEASRFESIRVGEHLPPRAAAHLRRLRLDDVLDQSGAVPSPGIRVVWGSPEVHEKDYLFNAYGSGWNLDRQRFDSSLLDRARHAGAVVHVGTRLRSIERHEGMWTVTAGGDDGSARHHARFVVDATGRRALIARRHGARREGVDRLTAMAARYESPGDTIDCRLLVEGTAPGWWYSLPLPHRQFVVAFMTDPGRLMDKGARTAAAWEEFLDAAPFTAARLRALRPTGRSVIRAAGSGRTIPAYGEGWIAVGDAAVSMDPLSSDGLSHAIDSAAAAADAIVAVLDGDPSRVEAYAAAQAAVFDAHMTARREVYRAERRWPDEPFWRVRHMDPDTLSLRPHDVVSAVVRRLDLPSGSHQSALTAHLCRLCQQPQPAFIIVRKVCDTMAGVTDEQVIFALQHLVADGIVELKSVAPMAIDAPR